jgi:hypothetical protein
LKAERAWFLDQRERRAKPETEQALPRWGKACVFLSHSAGAFYFALQPAELDWRFLVSGGVRLDVENRSSLDHIDSCDFDNISLPFENFDHGHSQRIGTVRASGGKDSAESVVEKRLCVELVFPGLVKGEDNNKMGKALNVF